MEIRGEVSNEEGNESSGSRKSWELIPGMCPGHLILYLISLIIFVEE
jgi:hypothetical protein